MQEKEDLLQNLKIVIKLIVKQFCNQLTEQVVNDLSNTLNKHVITEEFTNNIPQLYEKLNVHFKNSENGVGGVIWQIHSINETKIKEILKQYIEKCNSENIYNKISKHSNYNLNFLYKALNEYGDLLIEGQNFYIPHYIKAAIKTDDIKLATDLSQHLKDNIINYINNLFNPDLLKDENETKLKALFEKETYLERAQKYLNSGCPKEEITKK